MLIRPFLFSFVIMLLPVYATPLHQALIDINEPKMQHLVRTGSSINAVDENGRTALHLAARIGRLSMVEFLVEHGADVHVKDKFHKTPLVYAIEKNRVKVIMYLSTIVNKTIPEVQEDVFMSAQKGDLESVRRFYENVDINTKNEDGKTILHIAAEYGRLSIVKFALKKGVDIKIKDDDGRDALNYARFCADKNILKVIQEHNATQ